MYNNLQSFLLSELEVALVSERVALHFILPYLPLERRYLSAILSSRIVLYFRRECTVVFQIDFIFVLAQY